MRDKDKKTYEHIKNVTLPALLLAGFKVLAVIVEDLLSIIMRQEIEIKSLHEEINIMNTNGVRG